MNMDVIKRIAHGTLATTAVGILVTVVGAGVKFH